MFRPIHDQVVILPSVDTQALLESPDTSEGVVVSLGNYCKDFQVGDRVVYRSNSARKIVIEGVEHVMLSECDVLAVL
jgi:co-chaperonin GroES (HSP10)